MNGWTFLIVVCTLFLLGCQSSSAQDEFVECPPNEEEVDCVNPCNTCESQSKTCLSTDECVRGCDCKSGFLRNEFGHCVPNRFCGTPGIPAPTTEEESTQGGKTEVENRGGCPDAGKCNRFCQTQGFKFGICSGLHCTCSDSRLPVEKGGKKVAESGGCPSARICTLSCNRRGFKSGLCLGPERGFCNCYTAMKLPAGDETPGNREVAESGGCPSAQICTLSCNRRDFKSGLCLGPGRGFCNCYTAMKLPAGDETPGNREVAESGGCPSAKICTLSCNRRGFKSGLCLGPQRGFCNCFTTIKSPKGGETPDNPGDIVPRRVSF